MKSKKFIVCIVITLSVIVISSCLSLYEFHTFDPLSTGKGLLKVAVFHKSVAQIQSFPYEVYIGDYESLMKSRGYKLTDTFAPYYIFENSSGKKVGLTVFRSNKYFMAFQID